MGCILYMSTSREAQVIFTKFFHLRSFFVPVCICVMFRRTRAQPGRGGGSGSLWVKPCGAVSCCFGASSQLLTGHQLQLGTSSRAIHGGAYFSAVSGRKFNLTTVLRPCRPLACCWMFFSRPLSLLYWISLNCQVPWGWHCIFRWICLQNAKMDFFPTVLIAFPKTDLDFTDCCMNLFSTMTMFMFLCKYDRPSIILFVVFPSPLKRRSTQSSSCLIFAIK